MLIAYLMVQGYWLINSNRSEVRRFIKNTNNKDRSRIKVFETFEDVSKPSPSIDALLIAYGCVCKRSSKPVMKVSRVETV